MLLYILKRLVYVTPVAFGVSVVCFLLVHLAPGDPLSAVLPADATQATIDEMRAAYGFDKPLPVQYLIWLCTCCTAISAPPSPRAGRCSARSAAPW